jgi:signal transduction histidine kinase
MASLVQVVRSHQEEVNRLNKALKVANGLLKRSLAELALAQKEAGEARQLKEQFATTVSHELRTPLNIILGFLEVMQHYPEAYGDVNWTPTLRRDLGEIQRSASYLSALVNDILDLARVQALKMPIRRAPARLPELVDEVLSLATRLIRDRGVTRLVADVPADLPPLAIDETRIRQVLLNLVANACRFTNRGEVRVSARLEKDEVVVSVQDTGAGIPSSMSLFRLETATLPWGKALAWPLRSASCKCMGGGYGPRVSLARVALSVSHCPLRRNKLYSWAQYLHWPSPRQSLRLSW